MSAESTYKVQAVDGVTDKPIGKFGPMKSFYLRLEGVPEPVEWYTKATTAQPAPGAELFGTLESGRFGLQFKKAQQQRSNGGFQRDPAEGKRMGRAHAQEMALRYAAIKGKVTISLDDDLRKVIDWFYNDAQQAGE